MKPAPFHYERPSSLEEALDALTVYEDAKVLAGGQSLVPTMNMRLAQPSVLIDINSLADLATLHTDALENWMVGALVRHYELEQLQAGDLRSRLIRRAAREIGHLPIRLHGSIGGSLVHADPAAEWPVVVTALGGYFVLQSKGGVRRLSSSEFFQGTFTTAIEDAELLTRVELPVPAERSVAGFAEVSRRTGDFALALCAVYLAFEGDVVSAARVIVGGVAGGVTSCQNAELALVGCSLNRVEKRQIAALARTDCNAYDDINSTAKFQLSLVEVVVHDALADALGGAGLRQEKVS